jgi:hypothetical protein
MELVKARDIAFGVGGRSLASKRAELGLIYRARGQILVVADGRRISEGLQA